MHENILLEKMTWPEVREALDEGFTTAVFACGATEQHGPHLPLFTDSEHGDRLALEVAAKLGNALAAPTVRFGCSAHHMAFPGTISLEKETLEAVCRDYVRCLARHGFRHICIFPSHGGNMAPLADMLERLREAAGPETKVFCMTDLDKFIGVWKRVVQERSGRSDTVGGHADIAESSFMLVLHPETVRKDKAVPGCVEEPTPEFLDRLFQEGFNSVSPSGILGDPRGMNVEIGQQCINAMTEMLASFFRDELEASSV
ncbi:MAG: creatininase family protein [Thermovirgaceae bacterium]